MAFPKRLIERFRHLPTRQVTFSAIAGGFALATVAFIVYVSVFLAKHVREAFDAEAFQTPPPSVRFDTDGFERLHLTTQQPKR